MRRFHGGFALARLIQFTAKELARSDVLARVAAQVLSPWEAANLLGVTVRHLYRILERYREHGPSGVPSRKRGVPAHNRLPDKVRQRAIEIYRTDLAGYGPSYAAEVMCEEYGLTLSCETLRKILLESGDWKLGGKRRGRKRVHQIRFRSPHTGDIIQFDATEFQWVTDEPPCQLFVFVDDATSEIRHLQFAPSENSLDYLDAWKNYLQIHGVPIAAYADRHPAIFRVSGFDHAGRPILNSPLAVALTAASVLCIPSGMAEGRGRIERGHSTHQDRLPKFLQRRGARSIQDATNYLPEYIEAHNRKFAVPAAEPEDHHRSIPDEWDLDRMFRAVEIRRLSPKLSLSFKGRTLFLRDTPHSRACVGRKVEIRESLDGIRIFGGNAELETATPRTTTVRDPVSLHRFLH